MVLAYDPHDCGDDWGVIEHAGHGSWRFFRMNPVRDLLKSGKTVVGTAGSLYEDTMAMLADSGLDFILFDSQHAPVEVKQYQRSMQAMRGKKAAPIVRVSANRADVICFALGRCLKDVDLLSSMRVSEVKH